MKKNKSLIRLTDYTKEDVLNIFEIADDLQKGRYTDFLKGKTVVMFFPNSSIRTRVTFEKGIYLLGGQTILFPPETLDKREEICDVIGYLNNWADAVVIRHKNIDVLEKVNQYSKVPVINAMTDVNHPCEMLADLYSLSKMREDYLSASYLFCGRKCNIGLAWKEISDVMGLGFMQCCPKGYEIENVSVNHSLKEAVKGKDIICTDSMPKDLLGEFKDYQITKEIMQSANEGALLNPCPPFYRGEEVSADVIDSPYFVGYEFKKYLLEIQQAVIIYNLM
ncbi:MAG: peptide transporter [Lachnospiraceae bacterium]|nr:peptide transporter [Lachnospiraceae bacterium]